ncbi:type III-B CRISPR module RAMP protein Cmr6 [Alicyclobacillus vulcanalis]|uniref:CRISPR-associated protein Cmr6 n=1 Tax=Alicyclobacillus vulcanalis TaxID=252246 RepID=A0A1N7K6N1_9BACL|nr:type III-B CRISPR module RAMP protein Cmr6 [Alicyclobacillus vulcanalis]SIS57255.1 CRISPR-associated protein Cmr6 [Alicyclobacillus vulcanalis]
MRDGHVGGPLAHAGEWDAAKAHFGNPGLVFYRFGFAFHRRGTQAEAEGGLLASAYEDILQALCSLKRDGWYSMWYERAKDIPSRAHDRYTRGEIRFSERVAVGLGRESVYEVGLAFHPVYGVPYIPASTLKGLTAHYVHEVVGEQLGHSAFKRGGEAHRFLFGTVDEGPNSEDRSRGALVFHDALLAPESLACLRLDVMTVHYPSYYREVDTPHGMDDPIPIYFLSLDCPTFLLRLGIDCADPKAEAWLAWSWERLLDALTSWGVGGKTSSGLGRARARQVEGATSPAQPAGPKKGDVVRVRRIEPPEGKKGVWFETVDEPRLYGDLEGGKEETSPPIGEITELMLKQKDVRDPQRVKWSHPPRLKPQASPSPRPMGGRGTRR